MLEGPRLGEQRKKVKNWSHLGIIFSWIKKKKHKNHYETTNFQTYESHQLQALQVTWVLWEHLKTNNEQ